MPVPNEIHRTNMLSQVQPTFVPPRQTGGIFLLAEFSLISHPLYNFKVAGG